MENRGEVVVNCVVDRGGLHSLFASLKPAILFKFSVEIF
jgi:hypothetical protein